MRNREISTPLIIFEYLTVNYVTRDCDACSPLIFTQLKSFQYKGFSGSYSIIPTLIKQYVTPNYSGILSPFANTFALLHADALRYLEPSQSSHHNQIQKQLIQLGLLVPDNWKTPDIQQETLTMLSAWLHLSDACNLNCAYCYLPRAKADMTLATGQAAIDATLRSALAHGYRAVKFKYAGGEPLLRFPLLLDLHRYARQATEQQNLALDGVVITNGTLLTAAMVEQLRAIGLRVTISLDNLPASGLFLSQAQRVYSDGNDSARQAIRGIETALRGGVTPDISITASGRSVAQLPELLAWVLERDLPFSLNFYRDPSTALRATKCEDLQLKEAQFIEGMLAAYKVIEANLPRRSLLASLADMANFAAPHLRRCSVGHSYLVFDTHGRVSKCQMQIDQPVSDIRSDDPLGAVRAAQEGIQNLTVDEKEGCQECQWKYWCAGGCPLETYRQTGRYDLKSPYCAIYKALYPEALRLEGLRLLKYAECQDR